MYTKEELNTYIEELRVEEARVDKECYHKMEYSNPFTREIRRVKKLLEFIGLGIDFEESISGCIKIYRKSGGNIIYALVTGNWRVEGKKKWYRSGDVKKFVRKFVLDESSQTTYKENTTKENTNDQHSRNSVTYRRQRLYE